MQTTAISAGDVGTRARIVPLSVAAMLGLFVIGFVGFAQMDVVHNAAHDYRHSVSFPCH